MHISDYFNTFNFPCIRSIKIHFNGYDVFYSLYSHQYISAVIAAIFRVLLLLLLLLLLLQEYKDTNVVNSVDVTL